MTTLLCILRYFDELRATLVVEDAFDSSQTGVFAVFCFERVTQSKIVNAENVALQKAAKKNTLRRERNNYMKEKRAIAFASQRPNFLPEKERPK